MVKGGCYVERLWVSLQDVQEFYNLQRLKRYESLAMIDGFLGGGPSDV